MKPILEITYDKNSNEIVHFHPSGSMILFAIQKAKNPSCTEEECLTALAINKASHANWKRKYGVHYLDWLEGMIDQHTDHKKVELLEAVGMVEAVQGSFPHWNALAKEYGLLRGDEKNVKITINTDFSKYDAALSSAASFEDARRAILGELRGVEYKGRPGVAVPAGVRAHQGPGIRTVEVQGRSLEMDNSLGEDGGRPEREGALSAVPGRPSSHGDDPVLATVPASPSSEEPPDDGDMAF